MVPSCTSGGKRRNRWRSTFELLEARRVLATVAGTVFEDVNGDNLLDAGDNRLPGVTVYLDADRNGQLDQSGYGLDPDELRAGATLSNSRADISISATGTDNVPASPVRALRSIARATTGNLVFGRDESTTWGVNNRLRFDFATPADAVSLDVVGASASGVVDVRLDAYSASGQLLEQSNVDNLANAEAGRLRLQTAFPSIAYVVARVSSARGFVVFDNLRVNDRNDEQSTLTSDTGFYRIVHDSAEEVAVAQIAPTGYTQTSPAPELSHTAAASDSVSGLNFGNRTASILGFAFDDVGMTGVFDVGTDQGLRGTALYLDLNRNGIADQLSVSIDPDIFLPDQELVNVSSAMTIRTAHVDNSPSAEVVIATTDQALNPDGQIFARSGTAAWNSQNRLRIDFAAPASSVSLDFVAASDEGNEKGILIAFSHDGSEIESVTTASLERGQRETMTLDRNGFDIGYVIAYTAQSPTEGGRLDNLRATTVDEPVAISDSSGTFLFKPLQEGEYRVAPVPSSGRSVTFPMESEYTVVLEVGEPAMDLDFGFRLDNRPPVARDDAISTLEDTPFSVGVLANDFDPDGVINQGSVRITQHPVHGVATVTVDGLIEYTPNQDFFGRDSLIYTVRDDQGAVSNSALVTMDVAAVNDAPETNNDAVSILPLSSTVIDVIRNDTDVDGSIDRTSVTILRQPTGGSASVDAVTGNVTYTPNGIIDGDSFTYTVRDDHGAESNAATVTITALTDGVAPIARDDTASTLEGSKIDIQVLSNDTDSDGIIVGDSIVIVELPDRGEVVAEDGFVSYQPALGYIGDDTFSYIVRDHEGISSNIARVTVTMAERDFPYQNPINAWDVNGDGFVVPRDALLIINEINNRQISDAETGQITAIPEYPIPPIGYFDVNGDGFVVSNDVLRVINRLNSLAVGEPADDLVLADSVAAVFATDLDFLEDDEAG